jgi:hypothetical protein
MNGFQRFLTSRNFSFISVFMIFFSIITILTLDSKHPLYTFALVSAIVVFLLQQYRKYLIKRSR